MQYGFNNRYGESEIESRYGFVSGIFAPIISTTIRAYAYFIEKFVGITVSQKSVETNINDISPYITIE